MTTVQVDPESYARSDALAPSSASSQIDENVNDFGNIDDVIIQMDAVDTNNCFTVSTMFDFDKKLIEPLSFDEIVTNKNEEELPRGKVLKDLQSPKLNVNVKALPSPAIRLQHAFHNANKKLDKELSAVHEMLNKENLTNSDQISSDDVENDITKEMKAEIKTSSIEVGSVKSSETADILSLVDDGEELSNDENTYSQEPMVISEQKDASLVDDSADYSIDSEQINTAEGAVESTEGKTEATVSLSNIVDETFPDEINADQESVNVSEQGSILMNEIAIDQTKQDQPINPSTEAKEDKTCVVKTPNMSAVADFSEEDLESIYHDDNADKQEEVECLTCILSYLFFPKL